MSASHASFSRYSSDKQGDEERKFCPSFRERISEHSQEESND